MRSCACPGVFAEMQARFADRLRDRRHDWRGDRRGRVEVHGRCGLCGAQWALVLARDARDATVVPGAYRRPLRSPHPEVSHGAQARQQEQGEGPAGDA
jgi:hypothetical protein